MPSSSRISLAQNGEDVRVWRCLRHITSPRYVEVGGGDPGYLSNTAALYTEGWRGCVIEPNGELASRYALSRPEDVVIVAAASSVGGVAELSMFENDATSTIDNDLASLYRLDGAEPSVVIVPRVRLDDVFELVEGKEVHFLSIDVEGHELQALEGAELSKWRPWIVCVEAIHPVTHQPSWAAWEPLLLLNGYSFVADDGVNRWYLHSSHQELEQLLAQPFNPIDRIVDGWTCLRDRDVVASRETLVAAGVDLALVREQLAGREAELDAVRVHAEESACELGVAHESVAKLREDLASVEEDLLTSWLECDEEKSANIAHAQKAQSASAHIEAMRLELAQQQREFEASLQAGRASLDEVRAQLASELDDSRGSAQRLAVDLAQALAELSRAERWDGIAKAVIIDLQAQVSLLRDASRALSSQQEADSKSHSEHLETLTKDMESMRAALSSATRLVGLRDDELREMSSQRESVEARLIESENTLRTIYFSRTWRVAQVWRRRVAASGKHEVPHKEVAESIAPEGTDAAVTGEVWSEAVDTSPSVAPEVETPRATSSEVFQDACPSIDLDARGRTSLHDWRSFLTSAGEVHEAKGVHDARLGAVYVVAASRSVDLASRASALASAAGEDSSVRRFPYHGAATGRNGQICSGPSEYWLAEAAPGDWIAFIATGDHLEGDLLGSALHQLANVQERIATFDLAVSDGDTVEPILIGSCDFDSPLDRDLHRERFFMRCDLARELVARGIDLECPDLVAWMEAGLVARRDMSHVPVALITTQVQPRHGSHRFEMGRPMPEEQPQASISTVICTRDNAHSLRQLVEHLLADPMVREVIIVSNRTTAAHALELLQLLQSLARVSILDYPEDFNFSRQCNLGASVASGQTLLFLNDDIVPASRDWVAELAMELRRRPRSIVGPLLLFPDETVQHAGMYLTFDDAVCAHALKHTPLRDASWRHVLQASRRVTAVTGAAMMVERDFFADLNGFDPLLAHWLQDVDICLRAERAGGAVVFNPHSVAFHMESVSVSRRIREDRVSRARWEELLYFRRKWAWPSLRENWLSKVWDDSNAGLTRIEFRDHKGGMD